MRRHESWFALTALILTVAVAAGHVHAQGACCSPGPSCINVDDEPTCAAIGGVLLDGESCVSNPCLDGACCTEIDCLITDAYTCIAGGRDFAGAGVSCLDDPCAVDIGACCLPGPCEDLSPDDCDAAGGTWQGAGTSCTDGDCNTGACCRPGDCFVGLLLQCMTVGGQFSLGTTCVDGCDVPNGCPTDDLYGQSPDPPGSFTALLSELTPDVQRWDDFQNVPGGIFGIRFWGLDLRLVGSNAVECVESNNLFAVSLHEDALGAPGDIVCSHTLQAIRTPTGIMYGAFELNLYTVLLPETCVLPHGWLSIVGLGDTDCWFFWMGSPDGNGTSFCDNCDSPQETDDVSFCLVGSAGGIFGACCNLDDGTCADDVEIDDCIATGQRFAADTLCDSVDPPCAAETAACCRADGSCVVTSPGECVSTGGEWLGTGSTCDLCPGVGACCLGSNTCIIEDQSQCAMLGWTWLGPDTTCDDCQPLPECGAGDVFAQNPDEPSGFEAGTSEVGTPYQRYDDFGGLTADIVSMTFWALEMENLGGSNWVQCADPAASFLISFHDDNGGEPGLVVCSHAVTATRTVTGLAYFGVVLIEYSVTLPAPCDLTDGWVSIRGAGDADCWFLWMSSNFANGSSWCDGCLPPEQFSDFAVCLQTEGLPCPEDTNGSGAVDVDDLIAVILDWGTDGSNNNGDVDGSGFVDVDDIVAIILAWGPCG